MNNELFRSEPRDYALEMVENGLVTADHLLLCCLKYMSHDDVREMLDCNELSPRFDDDDDDDETEYELSDETDVQNAFWNEHPEYQRERDDDKTQNDYRADIRIAFCDWVDSAQKEGRLSDDLAGEVTL